MSAPTWQIIPPQPSSTTEGWWNATQGQRLVVQRCEACGHHQHHPRSVCTSCGATDALGFADAAGTGIVLSHTVIHRAPDPRLGDEPYLLALVRLDEGPTLVTHVWDADLDLHDRDLDLCDRRVQVSWLPIEGDPRHLPVFLLTD